MSNQISKEALIEMMQLDEELGLYQEQAWEIYKDLKQHKVMKTTYKNRYGDEFTFTLQEDENILWKGNFQYCRMGFPNDYSKAYGEYLRGGGDMELEDFRKEVHKYDDEKREYVYDRYVRLVEYLRDEIDMIDPSGGPYISRGMSLSSFGFKDLKVKDLKRCKEGYIIKTEKV